MWIGLGEWLQGNGEQAKRTPAPWLGWDAWVYAPQAVVRAKQVSRGRC